MNWWKIVVYDEKYKIKLVKSIKLWCLMMGKKRDHSICMSCKYQTGNWVSDRELDTWCVIKKGIGCDEVFECDDYELDGVIDDE